jgi:hypothetical protein
MAEKMPSSVKVGSRPMMPKRRSYSSGFNPWDATSAGVIAGSDIAVSHKAAQAIWRRLGAL